MNKHIIAGLLTICLTAGGVFAQSIHFPKGKTNDFFSEVDVLYFETEIRFYTRGCVSTDMAWEILSDSLDPRWDVSSCYNGDCRVGIPRTGTFISDYGINDTTVFIRFHVNTLQHTGISKITARVFNQTTPSIGDTISFIVRYRSPNTTGLDEAEKEPLRYIIHNGVLSLAEFSGQLRLFSANGQLLSTANDNYLPLPDYHGWFLLQAQDSKGRLNSKIIIW